MRHDEKGGRDEWRPRDGPRGTGENQVRTPPRTKKQLDSNGHLLYSNLFESEADFHLLCLVCSTTPRIFHRHKFVSVKSLNVITLFPMADSLYFFFFCGIFD